MHRNSSKKYPDQAQANINWSLFGTEICSTPPPRPIKDYSNGGLPVETQICRFGKCANGLQCNHNNVCFYPWN